MINLIIAILPVVLIAIYIYKKDKNKEPKKLLLKLFFSGLLSIILTLILSGILSLIIPNIMNHKTGELNLIELLLYAFICVALVEEFSKWIMTYLISYNSEEFDEVYDIIIYSVFVSLGFAGLENILYVTLNGVVTGIMRAFLSVPGHACNGVFMGYYFGLAKISETNNNEKLKRKNLALSVIVPTILHGIFDYCLMTEKILFLLLFLVFVILLYIHSNKKIKQYSNINSKIKYKDNYCTNCGTKVNSNYCPTCGKKNE